MRRFLVVTVVGCAALALAACGSSSSKSSSSSGPPTTITTQAAPPPGSPTATVALSADPTGALRFDRKSATAKAGNVKLVMKNPAPVAHGIAIQGAGVNATGQTVQSGGTSTVSAVLKPGTYTFYCPVPGHRQAGMEGTLTVR